MDEVFEGNDDRRSSVTSIANPAPSTVKEIQVTAKEIVDRISSFQHGSVGVDSIGTFDEKQGKPTGYVKPFTGGAEASSSNDEKGEESNNDSKGSHDEASPATSSAEKPGRLATKSSRFSISSLSSENGSVTIEHRAVEHLLGVVQVF